MGIFKKAISGLKHKREQNHDARRLHKNAGDRHHARKDARKTRRELHRQTKFDHKKELKQLKYANKSSKFGDLIGKVGPIANQFLSRKNSDGSEDSGFMNEDGTMELISGKVIKPNYNDTMYISKHSADDLKEAGIDTEPHNDFIDVDGDGFDDRTGKPNTNTKRTLNEVLTGALGGALGTPTVTPVSSPYSWNKSDTETKMQYIKRLFADKPLVMWITSLSAVGLITWGIYEGIKKFTKGKGKVQSWAKK